jgi:hypothetical protein
MHRDRQQQTCSEREEEEEEDQLVIDPLEDGQQIEGPLQREEGCHIVLGHEHRPERNPDRSAKAAVLNPRSNATLSAKMTNRACKNEKWR